MAFLSAVTNLGDTAFLAPFVLALAAGLAGSGSRREATVLVLAFAATGLSVLVLKLALLGCLLAGPSGGLDIRSPSGHAAMATVTFALAAALALRRTCGWRRLFLACAACGLIALVAASRVVLHEHTRNEVVAGLLVGGANAAVALRFLRDAPRPPLRAYVLPVLAGVAVLTYGLHLPAEGLIRRIAGLISSGLGTCR